MAAMNSHPTPLPKQGFHNLECLNFPSTSPLPSIQSNMFYNPGVTYPVKPETIAERTSFTPLVSELPILSLKTPLCPLCKGQKYGFTAYFHNPKIFSEPPHELLPLVEKSYVLKNRLKSLLVTYIMRDLEHDGIQEAEKEVLAWSQLVGDLLSEVMASAAGFELGLKSSEEVRDWTREMTKQILDSIYGRGQLEMPKGRLLVLLLEFRKVWERVWKAYLLDRKNRGLS